MLSCPRGCTRQLLDEAELYHHLRNAHRISEFEARRLSGIGGSGWYEQKQPTLDGEKAVEHQAVALRQQIAATAPLTVPIIKMKEKPDIAVALGWYKTQDGYKFYKVAHEEHTATSYTQHVLKGEIKGEFGALVLWQYTKDVEELKEQQMKASILEGRLASYVPSDPAYLSIAGELHETLYRIRALKEGIGVEVGSEPVLDERFSGENPFEEGSGYEKWVSEFMQKANLESERVISMLQKKDPIKL